MLSYDRLRWGRPFPGGMLLHSRPELLFPSRGFFAVLASRGIDELCERAI
jgi:hypothetical protein